MLRFLADENFNNNIVRGLLRRQPILDIVRVQDVGLSGADDPTLLEWAGTEKRLILTHDVSTMTHYAYERVKTGQPMPGVVEISNAVPLGTAIDDLLCLAECSLEGEWEGRSVICRCADLSPPTSPLALPLSID
jgi:predicted nuclease of predicted toxin-antitoxin system